MFQNVMKAEPEWALAHAGYGEAMAMMDGLHVDWKKVEVAANKAIELDPATAEAYVILGLSRQYQSDWKKAEEAYKLAIKLNPAGADAYLKYGVMLDIQRRFAEAEKNLMKAIKLEPFSPLFHTLLCEHYYFDHRYEKAISQCERAEQISPRFWLTGKKLYWIYVQSEKYQRIVESGYGDLSDEEISRHRFAKPLVDGNMKLYWQRRIDTRLNNPKRKPSPVTMAVFYAQLGDKEKALDYLEKAIANPNHDLPRANPDPVFDTIRNEPRFGALMKKVNLSP